MKVKDGFKFGVGFLIAYDIYQALCDADNLGKYITETYRNGKRIVKSIRNALASKE